MLTDSRSHSANSKFLKEQDVVLNVGSYIWGIHNKSENYHEERQQYWCSAIVNTS